MYICILIKSVKQNALILCLHQVHVYTLGVHRGRTLTALFIFSVLQWLKKVLIYSRTVNNHGNTSRRPSMSVCVHIHTTCIHCFMKRLQKMVDSLSLICSFLPVPVMLKTGKKEKKIQDTYIWVHKQQDKTRAKLDPFAQMDVQHSPPAFPTQPNPAVEFCITQIQTQLSHVLICKDSSTFWPLRSSLFDLHSSVRSLSFSAHTLFDFLPVDICDCN